MTRIAEMKVKVIGDFSDFDRDMNKRSATRVSGGTIGRPGGSGVGASIGDIAKGLGKGLLQGVVVGGGIGVGLAVANKFLEIISNAMEGIAKVLSLIQKMLEALIMPIVNLLLPLLLPILYALAPLVRVMNMLLRPVLQKMMEQMKLGVAAGGPMAGLISAFGTLIIELGKLTFLIFAESIKQIGSLFLDVIMTGVQAIVIFFGVFAKLFGIDMGGPVAGIVTFLEMFKQISQDAGVAGINQSLELFLDGVDGIYEVTTELNPELTLTQQLLTSMAGLISPETAITLDTAFKTINAELPNMGTGLGLINTNSPAFLEFLEKLKKNLEDLKNPTADFVAGLLEVYIAYWNCARIGIWGLQNDIARFTTQPMINQIASLQDAINNFMGSFNLEESGRNSPGPPSGVKAEDVIWKMFGLGVGVAGGVVGGLALGIPGAIAGATLGGALAFGDFIMRPGQPPVPFSPDDTIVGSKTGGAIEINMPISISGGGGLTQEQIDRIVQEVQMRLQSKKISAGGF